MKVKMFQMDCGESILVHCDTQCLIVDCGSRSGMITAQRLFDNVIKECAKFTSKQALITHFHEDHINGFMYITDENTTNFIKFSRVYIPYIFSAGQHWNLIDYMLIVHYLRNKKVGKSKNFSLLDLLKRMVQSKSKITILKRGSKFSACNSINDVLWPIPEKFEKLEFVNEISEYFPDYFFNRVFEISDQISKVYLEASDRDDNDNDTILKEIEDIESDISELNEDRFELNINSDEFKAFYKRLLQRVRIIDNNTSIVFQTNMKNNYLFTGDIGKSYLRNIVTNAYKNGKMIHNSFFAIKAPHHGTITHYVNELFGISSAINTEIVFISNGNAKSTGNVHYEYPQNANNLKYKLICSNRDHLKCQNTNKCANGYCPLNNNCINKLTFDII